MHSLASLAKLAVESYICEGKIISPPEDLPAEFKNQRKGTFVTITRNGNLRGCIGTYLPTKNNIAKEVISNAIAAATEDYRFGPIQREELALLSYTVYVLSEPRKIKDLKELNPKKYGIIVKTIAGSKTGILLPDLEGIDSIEQQVAIACGKGGINPTIERVIIYRFEVKKYQ